MNVVNYTSRFTDLIPFMIEFKLTTVYKKISDDKKRANLYNFKGTTYEVYGQAVAAQCINKRITYKARIPEGCQLVVVERYYETDHDYTNFEFHIYGENNQLLGVGQYTLNPSGDIVKKTTYQKSADDLHELVISVNRSFEDGKVVSRKVMEYVNHNLATLQTTRTSIFETDNKVTGQAVEVSKLSKDYATGFSTPEPTFENVYSYVSTNYMDNEDLLERSSYEFPSDIKVIESFLGSYSISACILDRHLKEGKSVAWIKEHCQNELRTFQDEHNNPLKNYPGYYRGCTIIYDKGYRLCVHTGFNKSNYYTFIDLSSVDIFDQDNPDLKRLLNHPPKPKYSTIINDEGNEVLNLYEDTQELTESMISEFDDFKNKYMALFTGDVVESIKKSLRPKKDK